jgi:hypothetical protein
VFITNSEGGTGIDYPSTPAISKNGGVRVIICIEPASYGELEQFKKRTGRMESQGTVFFVLNTPPNTTGEAYVATLRDTLKIREIHFIKKLQKLMDSLYP